MKFPEDPTQSADYLKKAIPLMVQRKIPTNPHNYALWYAHVTNSSPDLSRQLLFEFPTPGTYDANKSEELFFQYFVKNHLPQSAEAQDTLAKLLTQLFGVVGETTEGTHKYSQSLKSAITALQNSDAPAQLQAKLSDLLKDTDAMEQLTQEFQAELQTARREVDSLKQQLEVTEKSAMIDELTAIGNRRAFDQALDEALQNDLVTTSLILLDIDHFKQCNDNHGHLSGDQVLRQLGQLLAAQQSHSVQSARYGGEEFAVIVEGSADRAGQLAATLCRETEAMSFSGAEQQPIAVTISLGVAEAAVGEPAKALIKRADQALYSAKQQGRNRVVIG